MVHGAVDSITGTLGKTLHELFVAKGFFLDGYSARERMEGERITVLFGLA